MMLGVLTGCQTEETPFYDEPSVKMTLALGYRPAGVFYKMYIDGRPYTSNDYPFDVGGKNHSDAYFPLSVLDADSTKRCILTVQAIDRYGNPIKDPVEFPITVKKDTAYTIVHAVGDQPRLKTADNADSFFDVSLQKSWMPLDYGNNIGITFNEEKFNADLYAPATFYKENDNTYDVKFYTTARIGGNGGFDFNPDKQEPIATVASHKFTPEVTQLQYFMPLGGEMTLGPSEDVENAKAECLYIKPQIYNLSSDNFNGYEYIYHGKKLEPSGNYAAKGQGYEDGELSVRGIIQKQVQGESGWNTDTTYVDIFKGNVKYNEMDVVWDGTAGKLNEWEFEDPASNQSAFFRVSAAQATGGNYKAYDIELWLCSYEPNDYSFTKPERMVKRIENIKPGAWSEPIELHVKGDFMPQDIYDKASAAGKLDMYAVTEAGEYIDNEDYMKCTMGLMLKVFEHGTSNQLFTNVKPFDLPTSQESPFQTDYDDTGSAWIVMPPKGFEYKGYYLQESQYNFQVVNKQGRWQ